jgi:hypothetical protein
MDIGGSRMQMGRIGRMRRRMWMMRSFIMMMRGRRVIWKGLQGVEGGSRECTEKREED